MSAEAVLSASPLWQLQMLGAFRVYALSSTTSAASSRELTHFQTQKTALLMALLALRPATEFSREELTLRLWRDVEPKIARNRLSQALSWLRRHLETEIGLDSGAVIWTQRDTVRLAPGVVATDAARFDACLSLAGRPNADPTERAARLEEAVSLYAGPLLPGVSEEDDGLFLERNRLAAAFEDALVRAVAACEQVGRLPSAVAYARRLLALNPVDTSACAALVRILSGSDKPEALRVHAQFVRRREGLAETPATLELRRFVDAVRESPKPGKTVAEASSRLPLPFTPFFGREAETARLRAYGEQGERFVCLLGSTGTGKTRFALQVAAQAEAAGENVLYVSLDGMVTADRIALALGLALKNASLHRGDRNTRVATTDAAAVAANMTAMPGSLLLVVDNCEDLAGSGEALALLSDLLRRVPTLRILAVSRCRIGLDGEVEVFLPPLPVPAAGAARGAETVEEYDGVRMFLDRARRAAPDFRLTVENRDAVAAICARLEGLPLAIELCAPWVASLSPDQILADLRSRFDLLVSRRTDVPVRHQNLYAAVDAGYSRLTPALRDTLDRLTVFRGGWDIESAEAVLQTGGLRESLARLKEHSLIIADSAAPAARYRMTETLHDFALRQLAPEDAGAAAKRHAHYFLSLAEAAAPYLTGAGQRRWLDRLEKDHENLRATLDHFAKTEQSAEGLRLAVALSPFWNLRGYLHERRERLNFFWKRFEAHKDDSEGATQREARARNALGRAAWAQGDMAVAAEEHSKALTLWRRIGDMSEIASTLLDLALSSPSGATRNTMRTLLDESIDLARQAGNTIAEAGALLNLGNLALEEADLPRAQTLYRDCLTLAHAQGNEWLLTGALNNLGEIAFRRQDYIGATRFFEDALERARLLGNQANTALALLNLVGVARFEGKAALAASRLRECLTLLREMKADYLASLGLFAAAVFMDDGGTRECREAVATLLGACEALLHRLRVDLVDSDAADRERLTAAARDSLGLFAYDALFARGEMLPLSEALGFAIRQVSTLQATKTVPSLASGEDQLTRFV